MPLKIGSLFVSLTAQTDGFSKSMASALKDVEKFSREVKKAANDAAQVAGSITALGFAAVKLGSDVSGPAKAALDEFTQSTKQAAKPIAEALVPAMREMSAVVRGAGAAFAALSPETKAMVGEVFKVATVLTGASLVIGRLASTVNLLAGVFSGVFGAIAAIGTGPLLGILAAVAAIAAGVAVLHMAWRENWGGIQQVAAKVAQWFADTWSSVISFVQGLFSDMVDGLAGTMKAGLSVMASAADAFGQKDLARAIRGSLSVVDALAADLKSGAAVKRLAVAALDLGKSAALAFKSEWKRIFDELGLDFAKFAEMFDKLTSTPLTVGTADTSKVTDAQKLKESDAPDKELSPPPLIAAALDPAAAEAVRENFRKKYAAEKKYADDLADSLKQTAQSFVGKLGEAGSIINNVVNAAAQGGPWAAVAVALSELLSKTKSFVDVMNIAAGGLQVVTEALEPVAKTLFTALGQVLAPAFQVVAVAVQAISPVLATVAQVLEMVAPIVMLLVPVIRSLQPLLQFVADVLKGVFSALEPVFRVIFFVVQGIMLVVTAVQRGIVTIWNGLLEAIAAIVDGVVMLFTAGVVKNGGDFVRAGKGSVSGLDASIAELMNINYDAAKAAAARAAADLGAKGATDDLGDSIQKVNEAFTNIPSGFKVAAARFNADVGGYDPGGVSNGGSIVIGSITIQANDSAEAMDQLEAVLVRRAFRRAGYATIPPSMAGR